MKHLYTFVFLFILCLSCSSDGDKIDSSAITSYTWKLSAFKTSVPIDLNRDGVASTDMTLELDCLKNETFHFSQPNNDLYYLSDGVFVNLNSDQSVSDYHCSEDFPNAISMWGSSKMLDTNTIELYFKQIEPGLVIVGGSTFTPYKLSYKLIGNKLIRTSEESYPTTYNAAGTRWVNSTITITREYSRAF